jgi:glucose/arabinose dehydrogenase
VSLAKVSAVLGGLVLAVGHGAGVARAGLPAGFVSRTVAQGLEAPTSFAYAPDGRVFIAEKAGVLKVLARGRLEEFADLRDRINNVDDRGLLAVALDPDYADNGWIYLAYTRELRPDDPDKVHPAGGEVIRLRASPSDPNRADLSSIHVILTGLPTPGAWHSVGGIAFDKHGRLLVGMGDGSPYYPGGLGPDKRGLTSLVAQDLDSPNGKILRIDRVTGRGVGDNPFYDPAKPDSVRSKVLAFGLRNPFRMSVDPDSGDIWVGDPGSSDWEELDRVPDHWSSPQELNFGWPCYEGGRLRSIPQSAMVTVGYCKRHFYSQKEPAVATPAYAYHFNGAAIIGGPVYRGSVLFADFVHDRFFAYRDGKVTPFGAPGGWNQAVDIGLTPRGNIAVLAFSTGVLRVIRDTTPPEATGLSPWWIAAAALGGAALLAAAAAALRRARR